jgi:hypothetical protein
VFRRKSRELSAETENSALQAEVGRLSSLSLVALAVEIMDRAFTGEPGPDSDEPPWPVLFGRAPTAYEIANWLYLPRSEELDASQPPGLMLYALVSEALQVLEHASLIRSSLRVGFQGALADAHMAYALTRYGVSVRDAGAVERVLNGGTFPST